MRACNIAAAMTLAASFAHAQQELSLEGDDRELQGGRCEEVARGPQFWCWFRSAPYQATTRQSKLTDLRNKIEGSITDAPADLMWTKHDQFFTQNANASFSFVGDELPASRPKTTHTQGLSAIVDWELVENDMGLSGVYGTGSDSVVMRISEMANLYDGSTGLTPSVAFKFLIDGQPSQNIFGMDSFMSTEQWNFLDTQLTNRLKPFDTSTDTGYILDQTLRKKLSEGSQRPFGLNIGHVSQWNNDGSTVAEEDIVMPYQLYFRAPDKLRGELTDAQKFDQQGNQIPWWEQVKDSLTEGDVIYEVYAQYEPLFPGTEDDDLVLDDKLSMIAQIKLRSDLMNSQWGDENLYFQHVQIYKDRPFWPQSWKRLNEDLRFDPENIDTKFGFLTPAWPQEEEEAKALYADQMQRWGCPLEWLIPEWRIGG